ncbi:CpsD/CapB family tyrosine-protein kinase [Clostridium tarantellae]|uniref:non-specific protein-tyrosine kinase n=1 Tax=Clostridium tarantellae TaxID=39493 RepID=A0A6I1MJF8_9CLOT|nr:CpsD/CapB family tyrosine-protein kinase [Clostridium tarantellae]MPQ42287.1 polysaccharide biosynthesis tyrosine autokinase [Clostridium tarantellae]
MFAVEKSNKSLSTEAYRTLRTNLQYSALDREIKVILVTSSNPGEGKTTTAGNLAIVLAQDGKRVMLIDCDLRKANVHKQFKISNTVGLSEVLLGKETFFNSMTTHESGLHILTCGKMPPNPAEMVGSKAMEKLLNDLRNRYDYIVLDTPPVQAVTDSKVLATKSDGVVLVVRVEKTTKNIVLETKKELEKVNAKIIGTVLNGVSNKNGKNPYYYYGSRVEKNKKKKRIFSFLKG